MTTNSAAPDSSSIDWTSQISALLVELSAVQDELLEVISEKRELMRTRNPEGLSALQEREAELGKRLQAAYDQRRDLLANARRSGLAADNLQSLVRSPAIKDGQSLTKQVKDTSQRMRLLQHQSLTNWVVAQRTLLHLSQMLEIIATGGRLNATYGDTNADSVGGALVDREA